jgi:hypothetical protein
MSGSEREPELTHDDLCRVTGYRIGSAQTKFFRKHGLNVFPSRDGHPVVTWDAVTAFNLGGNKQEDEPVLDLAALRRTG